MSHVSVMLADVGLLELHGEPMLDNSESLLIVSAEDPSTYVAFNWRQVVFYSVYTQEECERRHELDDDE